MQLLRDNLTLWTSDMQNPGSHLANSAVDLERRQEGDERSIYIYIYIYIYIVCVCAFICKYMCIYVHNIYIHVYVT